METSNRISRQLYLWIVVWFLVLGVVLAGFGYWEMGLLKGSLHEYQQGVQDQQSLKGIELSLKNVSLIFWQVLIGSLAVIGVLLWLSLRSSVKRVIAEGNLSAPSLTDEKKQGAVRPEPTSEEIEERVREDQRRALHLLSLLQREGRLVDFLEEDLKAYDDSRIGAAVRSIQESCRETLNKYLAPEAVIERDEGDEVTVEAGFDANAIKLTGNVSGEPPFKGILQHRGWRATGFDLPTLSGPQDPAVIAPAEVEIPLD